MDVSFVSTKLQTEEAVVEAVVVVDTKEEAVVAIKVVEVVVMIVAVVEVADTKEAVVV